MKAKILKEVEGEGYFAAVDEEKGKIVLFDPFEEGLEGKGNLKIVGAVEEEELPPGRYWVMTDFFGPSILFALPKKLTEKLKAGTPVENVLSEFFFRGILEKEGVPKAVASKMAEIFGEDVPIDEVKPEALKKFAKKCAEKLKNEEKDLEDIYYEAFDEVFTQASEQQ